MTIPVEPGPYPDSIKRIYGKFPEFYVLQSLESILFQHSLSCMCNCAILDSQPATFGRASTFMNRKMEMGQLMTNEMTLITC